LQAEVSELKRKLAEEADAVEEEKLLTLTLTLTLIGGRFSGGGEAGS